jgi:hypothetical protein
LVKTNKENLLEIALQGEITHTSIPSTYTTTWDNKAQMSLGRGGIVYNVKVGDPCYGWELGDNVEPGVSADGTDTDRAKGGFRNLSNVGNRVKVLGGEAKGKWGTVIGKVGYLPGRGHHVVMHFKQEVLNDLTIGDKVQIRAKGAGLQFLDYLGVAVVSCSPELVEAWGIEETKGKLHVPVTKVVPMEYIGQGAGGRPPQASNWDIQTQSPDAVEFCKDLRFGDIVLLEDTLSYYGRGYYHGAVTVGVVITGPSNHMGHGIGVSSLLSCNGGQIVPKVDPDVNLKKMLELED